MQACCAQAGVAVVFVPSLPKTGVSGATRWLSWSKALIQLSLRYKTNDHLWFTFFHEAGHILLHGRKELFLEGLNGLDAEKEQEANAFAERELVPQQVFTSWLKTTPRLTKTAIVEFSNTVGIAPGIVVGQLQHKGLLPMTHCNDLKLKFDEHPAKFNARALRAAANARKPYASQGRGVLFCAIGASAVTRGFVEDGEEIKLEKPIDWR
jgi:hypothetical protein